MEKKKTTITKLKDNGRVPVWRQNRLRKLIDFLNPVEVDFIRVILEEGLDELARKSEEQKIYELEDVLDKTNDTEQFMGAYEHLQELKNQQHNE